MGVPLFIIHSRLGFSLKPSSYWGNHIFIVPSGYTPSSNWAPRGRSLSPRQEEVASVPAPPGLTLDLPTAEGHVHPWNWENGDETWMRKGGCHRKPHYFLCMSME